MTTITFHKTNSGEYTGFTCSGHADFDNYGKDIVCSSISVLVINTINSLEEIAHEKISVKSDERTGYIACEFPASLKEGSKILVDSLVLGISQIAKQYGEEYCKLEFVKN